MRANSLFLLAIVMQLTVFMSYFPQPVERQTGEQELGLPVQPRARDRRPKDMPGRKPDQLVQSDDCRHGGLPMTWTEQAWEFTVIMLSWFIACGALVFVIAYVALDAIKTRRKGRQ